MAVGAVFAVVLAKPSSSAGASGTSATPGAPEAVAAKWALAAAHGDTTTVRSLSCPGGADQAAVFRFTVGAGVTSVTPEAALPDGTAAWRVTVDVEGPAGPVGHFPVSVKRTDGAYRVC